MITRLKVGGTALPCRRAALKDNRVIIPPANLIGRSRNKRLRRIEPDLGIRNDRYLRAVRQIAELIDPNQGLNRFRLARRYVEEAKQSGQDENGA